MQVALQKKDEWVVVVNSDNNALIQHLLDIRIQRRLSPTNRYSKGNYGDKHCRFACEYRYLCGAVMVAECAQPVLDYKTAKNLVEGTKGVAEKVLKAICLFLKVDEEEGDVESDVDTDDIEQMAGEESDYDV